jgi:hypothetical protein
MAENKWFSMTVLEAFTHDTLSNNYMAWLYDYKHKNPASTLKTEYDLEENNNNEEGTDNNDDEQIFCTDLDEMEIAVPDNDGISGFKLVVDKSPEEYKAAQEAAKKVRKEGLANVSNCHHAQSYKKVASMLTNDASSSSNNSPCDAAKEAKKKKWQSMMGLKMYTGSGAKKSRRDSDKFKGWSEEGKAFIVKMMNNIKKGVDSGVHSEWEKMHRKITKVMKVTNE